MSKARGGHPRDRRARRSNGARLGVAGDPPVAHAQDPPRSLGTGAPTRFRRSARSAAVRRCLAENLS